MIPVARHMCMIELYLTEWGDEMRKQFPKDLLMLMRPVL